MEPDHNSSPQDPFQIRPPNQTIGVVSLLLPQLFIFVIFSRQTRLSSSVRPPGLGHGTRPQQQPTRSIPDQTTKPDNRSCLTTITSAFHLCNFQPSDQTIFLSQTSRIRPWNQTTTAAHKIHSRSDHQTRQSELSQIWPQIRPCTNSQHLTILWPDHQNQPIRSDHHRHTRLADQISPTDYHPWLLHFKSAQDTQPREIVQVRCIVCGLGQGGYILLWMNLAKHTFHTRSAWSFRFNLTVVTSVSGFPRAGKGLPCPFL